MDRLRSIMKIQAALVMGNLAFARIGLVSAAAPHMAMVKVKIQPENVETGWMPVLTPFVGNGWGLVAHLSVGDQVVVLFQEGRQDVGIVIGALFSAVDLPPDATQPPADLEGQFWLQHKSGSLLKFTNDGNVTIVSNGDLDVTAGGTVNVTGDVNITGNLTASGTVKGSTDVQAGAEPVSLVNHKHIAVQTGSGVSGPPQ